jgi:hypothetical protein
MIIPIGPLCVAAELLKTNDARNETYPFDWARSNILSVIDVIKFGHEYHCENNIENVGKIKYSGKRFQYIFYPHHNYVNDKDYLIRCSNRLFDKLNGNQKISFLYMSNINCAITKSELQLFIKTVEQKYVNLIFKVIMIYYIGQGEEIYLKEKGNKYKIYHCKAPKQFYSNPMRPDIFYKNMFDFVFNKNKLN